MATHAQLKAFHAVALERNFHRAAARLHLTQPAISIQVRNLERDSGTSLFRRSGHAVDLTEDGRCLFERTTRLFRAEAEAVEMLRGGQATHAPTIHLGADGPHVALDLIATVRAELPDIRFRVTMANADRTWENLVDLKVDAAVMANAKPDRRVVAHRLGRQDLCLLVPANHALARRKQIGLSEIAALPLIFREPGSNTQRIVDEALARVGDQVSPHLVLGSREAVIEATARGLGLGFLFSREALADPRCVGVSIAGLADSNVDELLYLKDNRRNPLVAALAAAAKSRKFG